MPEYSAEWVTAYFDEFGEREWNRLSKSVTDEVSLHLHRLMVARHVRAGQRVLDIGAGPGVFTEQCHALGARVVVADISPVQVELNRRFAQQRGFAAGVEQWRVLDVLDMGALEPASFDVVLALGGPLSYVFDRRQEALAQITRLLKPGGIVLASVMSIYGGIHRALHETLDALEPAVIASGDLHPDTFPGVRHRCHMYRSHELEAELRSAGLQVLGLSGSGCLTAGYPDADLRRHRERADTWAALLQLEEEAATAPGGRDMGDHIIAAARLPGPPAAEEEAVLLLARLAPLAGGGGGADRLAAQVSRLYSEAPADRAVLVTAQPPAAGAGFGCVALAGVFDRLHRGHRALLTVAAALARARLVVGVLAQPGPKRVAHLVQSPDERVEAVRRFLARVRPGLRVEVQRITRCEDVGRCPMADAGSGVDAIVCEDSDEAAAGRAALSQARPELVFVAVPTVACARASQLRLAALSRL